MHQQAAGVEERQRVGDAQEAVDGHVIHGPQGQRPGASGDVEHRPEVVPLDREPAGRVGATYHDVLEIDQPLGASLDLDTPVGRSGGEEPDVALGDDVEHTGRAGDERRAQAADLDGEISHAGPPARRAAAGAPAAGAGRARARR